MCEPTTIMMVATVASAAVGAYSSIQQGRAQYQAEMYNAQIAERNAQNAEDEQKNVSDAAAIERRRLGERVRAEKGDLNAKFTAMGVDANFGTPADLVGDVQQAYNIDRSILGRNEITNLHNLDLQVADYKDSARMSRSSAKGALKAGYLGAAKSVLDSAASVSSHWIMPGGSTGGATAPVTVKTRTPPRLSPFKTPGLVPIGAG